MSWTLILQRAAGLRAAYAGFDIAAVAAFGETDRQRLLADAKVIRNRLKINAAIHNAQQILQLQQEFGSFKNWLDGHHPQPLADWVKLFRRTFIFTGPEIVREFLVSAGYLKGAHSEGGVGIRERLPENLAWRVSAKLSFQVAFLFRLWAI